VQSLRCWSAVGRTGLSGAGMSEVREGNPRNREPMVSGAVMGCIRIIQRIQARKLLRRRLFTTFTLPRLMEITGRTSSKHSPPNEPLLRPSISRLVIYASLQGPTSPRHHGDERGPMPNCPSCPRCHLSCGFHSYSTFMQFHVA
jgi:hypothetical protein